MTLLLFLYRLGPGSNKTMQTFVIWSKEKHRPSVNWSDGVTFWYCFDY